ncbi:MAG TPA: ATP-binding protein [Candidatus Obscuribacterales bacterium]
MSGSSLNDKTDLRSLAGREDRTRLIIDRAYDAFVEIDPEGVIRDWNVQAERIFGWRRDEAIGRQLSDMIIPERYRDAHRQGLKKYGETGEGPAINKRIEISALHRDGREFPVELAIFVVPEGDKHTFCAFIHDISERKQAEERLNALTSELKRSNAELQHFAYIAAHDLREPLRTILSYISLLSQDNKDKLDDDSLENLSFIIEAAKRMQQMVTDLLSYARVQTHGKEFVPTDCNAVLKQASEALSLSAEEAGARITCGELPEIMADPNQIFQLFLNLLANAMKFRRDERPEVNISAERKNGHWLFAVNDNGIGFPMESSERIFQMFQRLHTSDEYEGTGVGLAICRRIVERHGGTMWAESELGKGATFYFTIPATGGKQ